MTVYNDILDYRFDLPDSPVRVVSLNAGTTEAIFAMGRGDRVVGVSEYCSRYVPDLDRPVVGDYLAVERPILEALKPDLILTTSGVQRRLAVRLARDGFPVYALPLPNSIYGVLENIVAAGGLLNAMEHGRKLAADISRAFDRAHRRTRPDRPRVYVELWFGRHRRTVGGFTYIHDLVEAAGGAPAFAGRREAYLEPDLHPIDGGAPDVLLGFSEPEYPVNFAELARKRGWDGDAAPTIITSTIERGRNVIHDGPSIVETVAWLANEFSKWPPRRATEGRSA